MEQQAFRQTRLQARHTTNSRHVADVCHRLNTTREICDAHAQWEPVYGSSVSGIFDESTEMNVRLRRRSAPTSRVPTAIFQPVRPVRTICPSSGLSSSKLAPTSLHNPAASR